MSFFDVANFGIQSVCRGLVVLVVESPEKVCGNGIAFVVVAFGRVLSIVICNRKFFDEIGDEAVQIKVEQLVQLRVTFAMGDGVEEGKFVHIHFATSAGSVAVATQKPQEVVFLSVLPFDQSVGGPYGQILVVSGDRSECMPALFGEQLF